VGFWVEPRITSEAWFISTNYLVFLLFPPKRSFGVSISFSFLRGDYWMKNP